MPMENAKKSRGRQKLKIKFIEDDHKKRMIEFSKRQNMIYKKASELCILTGIDILILIKTRSGDTFSFVHPNNERVETQFSQEKILPKGILEPYQARYIEELASHRDEVCKNMKLEMKRASDLKGMKRNRIKHGWEMSMNELELDEAQNVKEQLRELKERIFKIISDQYRLRMTATQTSAVMGVF